MAFDAGDIQGRLTLDRTPFTRELDKAQRQAKDFSKATYTATLDADRSAFTKGINQARAAGVRFSQAKYAAKLSADRHELTAALKKAAEDVKRFNRSSQGAGTNIGVNEAEFRDSMKRLTTMSRSTGIQVANNFRSPMRKIKWPAIFAAITAAAIAVPPALLGVAGAAGALVGAFVAPIKALTQFNKAADAVAEGSSNAAEQVAKFNGMAAKLTPEGRNFVAQAMEMRDEMSAFGKAMQTSVLPGFTSMLTGLEDAAPAITRGSAAVGAAVSDVAAATGELFRSTKFQGQLEQAFENSVPVVRSLGMFVRDLFRDMTTFTASTRSLGLGLSGMLDNVSDGFTRFFDSLIPYSDDLGSSFDSLGGIVGDLLGALGRFSGIIASGFGSGLGVMRDALNSIYDAAMGLLSGAMPGLTTAFSGVASAVGGVASVLAPLAPLLGSVTGFLAPFAVALKAVDMISFGRVGANFSVLKANIKGASGPIGKLKTGVGGLASAFGPLGIAAAGLGIVLSIVGDRQAKAAQAAANYRSRVQELTEAIIADNGTMGAATQASIAKTLADQGAIKAASALGISVQSVTKAVLGSDSAYKQVTGSLKEQMTALSEQGKFFKDGEIALSKQGAQLLVLSTGLESERKAAQAAAQAALELKAAENGVTTATLAHWNALNQLNSAMMASLDKNLAYREAQLQLKQATEAAATALKNEGKSSDEYKAAALSAERQTLSLIVAKGEQVKATNALLPPERQATLATKAMDKEAFRLAQTLTGPGKKAALDYVAQMSATSAKSLGARDSVNKAGEAVRKLPNGKTIKIVANTGNFWAAVRQIQAQPIVKAITFSVGPLPSLAMAMAGMGRAKGGIDEYATGGMTYKGRRVTPMSSASAGMVPANTPRIIGDNTAVRESFIPHDKSQKSRSILRQTNQMMGDPLNVNTPVAGVAVPQSGGDIAGLIAALESMDITLSVGGQVIDERVEIKVAQGTRKLMQAVRAGAGRSRG